MLNLSDQLDILNSDTRILDLTKRQGQELSLSGEVFPDGQPFRANIEGEPSFALLQSWIAQVRSEWNARQASKEAAEAESAAAHKAAQQQDSSVADDGRRGDLSVKDDIEIGEASLEETLRTKVAVLDRAYARWADIGSAAQLRLGEANRNLARIHREQEFITKMLKELTSGDSSEDSSSDSSTVSSEEELGA